MSNNICAIYFHDARKWLSIRYQFILIISTILSSILGNVSPGLCAVVFLVFLFSLVSILLGIVRLIPVFGWFSFWKLFHIFQNGKCITLIRLNAIFKYLFSGGFSFKFIVTGHWKGGFSSIICPNWKWKMHLLHPKMSR